MAKSCIIILEVILICFSFCYSHAQSLREQVVELAESQIGVAELTPNSSPDIDYYNYIAGCQPRDPWCGSWAFFVYDSCGLVTPIYSCRAANWFPKDKIIRAEDALIASTVGLYSIKEGRIYHMGISSDITEDDFQFISGNWTNSVKKTRYPITQQVIFSDWIDQIPTWYTVKQGDTIYAISNRFEVDIKDVMQLNGLDSYRIQIGQKLRLK